MGSSGKWYHLTINLAEKITSSCDCKSSKKRCRHAIEVLANISKNLNEDGVVMQTEMIEHLMSSHYGLTVINKSGIAKGLRPFCEKCGAMKTKKKNNWFKSLFKSKSKRNVYECLSCDLNMQYSMPLKT